MDRESGKCGVKGLVDFVMKGGWLDFARRV